MLIVSLVRLISEGDVALIGTNLVEYTEAITIVFETHHKFRNFHYATINIQYFSSKLHIIY